MSKKPIIAVTPLFDAKLQSTWMYVDYFEAVEAAGGVPVMLSMNNTAAAAARLLEVVDGVLFPGGKDICPLNYGADISDACGVVVPKLDEMEIMLAKMAFDQAIPILGLCRGSQLINVALGGSLCQDIPSKTARNPAILHVQKGIIPKDHAIHRVDIESGTRLNNMLGQQQVMVNSFHHQSIKDVASPLKVAARAPDGIIEAVESISPNHFALGVQWHPEMMFRRDENAFLLFRGFIDFISRKLD